MTSRDRILAALNFQEADRVPFDLAATTWTGITNGAYQNLLKQMEKPVITSYSIHYTKLYEIR